MSRPQHAKDRIQRDGGGVNWEASARIVDNNLRLTCDRMSVPMAGQSVVQMKPEQDPGDMGNGNDRNAAHTSTHIHEDHLTSTCVGYWTRKTNRKRRMSETVL